MAMMMISCGFCHLRLPHVGMQITRLASLVQLLLCLLPPFRACDSSTAHLTSLTPHTHPPFVCRPITQRVLSIKPMPGQDVGSSSSSSSSNTSFAAAQQQAQLQQQVQQAAGQVPAWVPDAAAAVHQQQAWQQQHVQQAAAGAGASFAASAVQAAAAPTAAGPASAQAAAGQPPRQQQQGRQVQAQEGEQDQHPMMLPVSAVAAGWAPDRGGKAPTGSGERGGWAEQKLCRLLVMLCNCAEARARM